jgi:hypothetical protein
VSSGLIPTLFADVALARRIEAAECGLIAGAAEAVRQGPGGDDVLLRTIGGGVAVFTRPGEPWNKVAGLGFESLEPAALEDVEREFQRRRAPLQVEFPSVGDNTICESLTRRGYTVVGFENVLGLRLDGSEYPEPPPGIEVAPVGAEESSAWIDTVITGFEHPDASEGPRPHESFAREALERVFTDFAQAPGFRRYLARLDGAVARAGCVVAVVTTQPGSRSQANAQRQGFALLYTRAILVRPPASEGPETSA